MNRKERWQQRDFFIADLSRVAVKDDLATMEHPFFALRAGDRRTKTYKNGEKNITVKPSCDGCATVHDKDVLIYAMSLIIDNINKGRDAGRVIHFSAFDFMRVTDRGTSGKDYERLAAALRRLKGTIVQTNISVKNKEEEENFGLIERSKITKHNETGVIMVSIELPTWLMRSIKEKRVLTINPDYFKLRKPLDRRIYELARKHCGHQAKWKVSIPILYRKSGSSGTERKFRAAIKKIKGIPDYHLIFNEKTDTVTFYSVKNDTKARVTDLLATLRGCG
ncbi:MAG: replication initiator protein A [Burkholderiales bacterium]|jgi:plasmid replication initiation protein|nr:replication initiator protein A [Burkholderiales bacterium]